MKQIKIQSDKPDTFGSIKDMIKIQTCVTAVNAIEFEKIIQNISVIFINCYAIIPFRTEFYQPDF